MLVVRPMLLFFIDPLPLFLPLIQKLWFYIFYKHCSFSEGCSLFDTYSRRQYVMATTKTHDKPSLLMSKCSAGSDLRMTSVAHPRVIQGVDH